MARGTSEYGGMIRGSGIYIAEQYPLSTSRVRNGLANNLAHAIDSRGQILVNIGGRLAGKAVWDGPASSTAFARVAALPPLPIILRPDQHGVVARAVVTMRGLITSAGTATWRFAVRPFGGLTTTPPPPASSSTYSAELSTTSASVVELGPVEIAFRTDPSDPLWLESPSADAADRGASIRMLFAQLEVWTFSTSTGIPRMSQLTVREWVG